MEKYVNLLAAGLNYVNEKHRKIKQSFVFKTFRYSQDSTILLSNNTLSKRPAAWTGVFTTILAFFS